MHLGFGRDHDYSLTLYCAGYTTRRGCSVGWKANWDQLIQYFGLDADLTDVRPQLLRIVGCPSCGRAAEELSLQPPEKSPGQPWRAWHWENVDNEQSSKEQGRRTKERTEHQRLMAAHARDRQLKDQADRDAEVTRKRSEKLINDARAKGVFLIGPPNPHQFKKSRPMMKG